MRGSQQAPSFITARNDAEDTELKFAGFILGGREDASG